MSTKNPCGEVLLLIPVHLSRAKHWTNDDNDLEQAVCGLWCSVGHELARLSASHELGLSAHEEYCGDCMAALSPIEHLNLVDL